MHIVFRDVWTVGGLGSCRSCWRTSSESEYLLRNRNVMNSSDSLGSSSTLCRLRPPEGQRTYVHSQGNWVPCLHCPCQQEGRYVSICCRLTGLAACFMLVSCFAYSLTLGVDAVCSISTGSSAILTEVFPGFLQSFHANAEIVLLLSTSLQCIIYWPTRASDAKLLTSSLNKPVIII
jgi:hypothetical protein